MHEAKKIALTGVVLLVLGLLAVAIELLKDSGRKWLALIVASLVLLALALSVQFARAHDHDHPELNGWFLSLHNKQKVPCCDGSDATRLSDVDWESRDGHYRVRLNGLWVDVPDDAVIDAPNQAGQTMVWPFYLDGELRGIRCFMPGAMI